MHNRLLSAHDELLLEESVNGGNLRLELLERRNVSRWDDDLILLALGAVRKGHARCETHEANEEAVAIA